MSLPHYEDLPPTGMNTPAYEANRQRISQLEQLRERGRGAWWVIGGLGVLLVPGLLAVFAWTWSLNATLTDVSSQIARVDERLSEHMRQGGPQGHPESVIQRTAANEGRIRALEQRMGEIRESLSRQDDKLDTILERLPRRR